MSAHTPGRLVAVPCTDSPGAKLMHEHVSGELRFIAHVSIPADARRLAACWNACEGPPTEQIEELASISGVPGLWLCLEELRANNRTFRAERDSARAELATARADLEKARVRDEVWHEHTTRKSFELSEAIADSQAIEANYEAARALLEELLTTEDVHFCERIRQFLEPK